MPDYLTSVKDGGFYGWPYSYYGQHVDDAREAAAPRPGRERRSRRTTRSARTPRRSDSRSTTGKLLPAHSPDGAFVGQHGSWNRKPRSGYKVIFVPFADGKPAGPPEDVLTGFLTPDGNARGRPVGVAVDKARRAAGRRRRRQRRLESRL